MLHSPTLTALRAHGEKGVDQEGEREFGLNDDGEAGAGPTECAVLLLPWSLRCRISTEDKADCGDSHGE